MFEIEMKFNMAVSRKSRIYIRPFFLFRFFVCFGIPHLNRYDVQVATARWRRPVDDNWVVIENGNGNKATYRPRIDVRWNRRRKRSGWGRCSGLRLSTVRCRRLFFFVIFCFDLQQRYLIHMMEWKWNGFKYLLRRNLLKIQVCRRISFRRTCRHSDTWLDTNLNHQLTSRSNWLIRWLALP